MFRTERGCRSAAERGLEHGNGRVQVDSMSNQKANQLLGLRRGDIHFFPNLVAALAACLVVLQHRLSIAFRLWRRQQR